MNFDFGNDPLLILEYIFLKVHRHYLIDDHAVVTRDWTTHLHFEEFIYQATLTNLLGVRNALAIRRYNMQQGHI